MSVRRALAPVAVVAGVLLALAGCSSDGTASTATSASLIGGMTTCDEAAISEAVTSSLSADEKFVSLNAYECKDGWAVADATVGPTDGSADGEIDVTYVFEAEGQFWIPKDRTDVCGTISDDASPAYPSDAAVPESLWPQACLTN